MASLSASGLAPMSVAIAGREVAMIVASMFSMNSATATMRGTRRLRSMSDPAGARSNAPRLEGTLQFAHAFLDIAPYGNAAPYGFGSGDDNDLHPGCLGPAAWPVAERSAVLRRLQRAADHVRPALRVVFPGAVPAALDPCRRRGTHAPRRPQAPRTGGRHRAPRPAAVVDPLRETSSRGVNKMPGTGTIHWFPAMLPTVANSALGRDSSRLSQPGRTPHLSSAG